MEEDPVEKIINNIYKSYSVKFTKEAFKILYKLFSNIINNPDDDRYKIFKKTNINIQLKVLIIKECKELIEKLGYVDNDEESLIFKGDIKKLKQANYVLKEHLNKIEDKLEEEAQMEEIKRQEDIRKQIEESTRLCNEKKLEREKLTQQCMNDRKEIEQRMKLTDSVAKDLKFGAKHVKVNFECSGGGNRR